MAQMNNPQAQTHQHIGDTAAGRDATEGQGATGPSGVVFTVAPEDISRADLYDFLGRLLARAPNQETLDQLALLEPDETEIGRAIFAVRRLSERLGADEVDREYHRLFIGMGRGELLPFASYYLTGFLNEKPLATLRNDMARMGLARADTTFEPEDNIASLCEMMGGLIRGRFGDPLSLDEQRTFFNAHLEKWAGHFFSDLEASENAVFYAPVGTLGRQLIEIERNAFRMVGEATGSS